MKLKITRETLLKPLQTTANIAANRVNDSGQIRGGVLLRLKDEHLQLTGTGNRLQLLGVSDLPGVKGSSGEIAMSGTKLLDICNKLPNDSELAIEADKEWVVLKSGRSRFKLAVFQAAEYPVIAEMEDDLETSVKLSAKDLIRLIRRTVYAMATEQDVRDYLRGVLLEARDGQLRSVATDGHRLAMCSMKASVSVKEPQQAIVPRASAQEMLSRLDTLDDKDVEVELTLGQKYIRLVTPSHRIVSMLVDAKYPDYERVIPRDGNNEAVFSRKNFEQMLSRINTVLVEEDVPVVRLAFSENMLRMLARNYQNEEAEEDMEVEYKGESLEIGFNIRYMHDLMHAFGHEEAVRITMTDANSSALIQSADKNPDTLHVIMPMRF